jgi:hypothetical protein
MNVRALLADLDAHDVRLTVHGGRVRVDAPRGALSPARRAQIAANRHALLELLDVARGRLAPTYEDEERASILEFDAGLARPDAERAAFRDCLLHVAEAAAHPLVVAAESVLAATLTQVVLPNGSVWTGPPDRARKRPS